MAILNEVLFMVFRSENHFARPRSKEKLLWPYDNTEKYISGTDCFSFNEYYFNELITFDISIIENIYKII